MALGAAIWAGLGAGVFKSYADAIARMMHIEGVVTPDASRRDAYDALYRLYTELYPAAKATMHSLATTTA